LVPQAPFHQNVTILDASSHSCKFLADPWPPLPSGLIETAFDELARRWKPILDAHEDQGVDLAFELHPGEDLFDGVTFERFLDRLKGHKRCNINYDPSHFRLQA